MLPLILMVGDISEDKAARTMAARVVEPDLGEHALRDRATRGGRTCTG